MTRKRRIVLVAIALLTGVVAVWQFGFHGLPPALILSPPPVEPVYPSVLDERAEIDVAQVPLREAIQSLARKYHVDIVLDREALDYVGVTGNEPVTCRLSRVPLRRLIELLSWQVDRRLMVAWPDGRVHISTTLVCGQKSNYVARVYRLTEVLATTGGLDEHGLAGLICNINSWSWSGAGGGFGAVEVLPGTLIVTQTPDVHRQIELCLDQLTQNARPPIDMSDPHPDATAEVTRALDRDVLLKLSDVPLNRALSQIGEQRHIPVWIDAPELSFNQIEADERVSCSLPRMSLREALHELLKPLDLAYSVRGGLLTVTTHWWAEESFVRTYPARDLDAPTGTVTLPAEPIADHDTLSSLAALVEKHIRPDSRWGWERGVLDRGRGFLAFRTNWETQQIVGGFVAALREARPPSPASRPGEPMGLAVNGNERIEKTLTEKVFLSFHEAAIADIARELEHRFQIPARLSHGLPDVPVTHATQHESLEVALREMLRPSKSAFVVQGEELLITPRHQADEALETRIHRVRRFAQADPRFCSARNVAETVREVTSQTWNRGARVDSWQDLLAVRQSREVHRQLAALLDAIERVWDDPSPLAVVRVPMMHDETHELRVYRLAGLWASPASSRGEKTSTPQQHANAGSWYSAWNAAEMEPQRTCIIRRLRQYPEPRQPRVTTTPAEQSTWLGSGGMGAGVVGAGVGGAAAPPPARRTPPRPRRAFDSATWQVGESLCAVVRPFSWEPSLRLDVSDLDQAAVGDGALAVLPELLVVRQTPAVHEEISRFLDFLRALDDLPRPWELDEQRPSARQAELIRHVRTTDDPFRRRYVLACLAMIAEPNDEVVDLIDELLSGPDFCSRPDEAYLVGLLIDRLLTAEPSPADDELVRLVSDDPRRRQAILTLVAVGRPAAESLSMLLQQPSAECAEALETFGSDRLNPDSCIARWLRSLLPSEARLLLGPKDHTLKIIRVLDPDGRRTYAVLERWRRDADDLSPDTIDWLQDVLDSHFHKQVPPEATP